MDNLGSLTTHSSSQLNESKFGKPHLPKVFAHFKATTAVAALVHYVGSHCDTRGVYVMCISISFSDVGMTPNRNASKSHVKRLP